MSSDETYLVSYPSPPARAKRVWCSGSERHFLSVLSNLYLRALTRLINVFSSPNTLQSSGGIYKLHCVQSVDVRNLSSNMTINAILHSVYGLAQCDKQ